MDFLLDTGRAWDVATEVCAEEWPEAQRIIRQLFETRDVLQFYAKVCGRWERN